MIRTILHYPDPRLRRKAEPIAEVTPDISRLIDDMAETMYAAPGVGLAAPQIGEAYRLFIIDVAADDEERKKNLDLNNNNENAAAAAAASSLAPPAPSLSDAIPFLPTLDNGK